MIILRTDGYEEFRYAGCLSHLLIYIYHCKLNGVKPVMQVLKTKIRAIHNIEGIIAFRRRNIYVFYTKPKNGQKSNHI